MEFVVRSEDRSWLVSQNGRDVLSFANQTEAMRAADLLARDVNHAGVDARVMVRTADGGLHLDRSYGRHPLIQR